MARPNEVTAPGGPAAPVWRSGSVHTTGCKSVNDFATPGWRRSSRSDSRQYQISGITFGLQTPKALWPAITWRRRRHAALALSSARSRPLGPSTCLVDERARCGRRICAGTIRPTGEYPVQIRLAWRGLSVHCYPKSLI
ncbi:hypothetical protein LC1Hm_0078 [Halomicrobium sp. LC1Hm]|nr:hypothetical protein LC1Hm_0078 [Halomicrobium sp. LC1Hm]